MTLIGLMIRHYLMVAIFTQVNIQMPLQTILHFMREIIMLTQTDMV